MVILYYILFVHVKHSTSTYTVQCLFIQISQLYQNELSERTYEMPSLACSSLVTQAAWYVTSTDVTNGQIITPQQVQPSNFPLLMLILLQLVFPVHVENICIGGPSCPSPLFSPPSSFTPTPLFCLLMCFSFFFCWKREALIVNMERCKCQKKWTAYFWIQAARFTEAYFYHEKPTWNGTAMRSCWSNLL